MSIPVKTPIIDCSSDYFLLNDLEIIGEDETEKSVESMLYEDDFVYELVAE